jgi:FtsP/CotA-like multicopper oxidase with cupredoxin domain
MVATRQGLGQGGLSIGRHSALRQRLFSVAAILVLAMTAATTSIVAAARPQLCQVAAPTIHQGTITNADRLAAAERAAAARAACTVSGGAKPFATTLSTPDYFGTAPNYANSPLPGSGASVTIADSGGGTGAVGAATVVNGTVTAVSVVSGGNGYTSGTTTVSLSGGSGAGAIATATVTGIVSSIAVTNGGTGYTAAPAVTIAGTGTGATATAIVSGVVTNVPLYTGGTGYTAPIVSITGGGGTGATASAIGQVEAVVFGNAGTGYVAPVVTFTGGGATTQATATATLNGTGGVIGIAITSPGSGYATAPAVAITDATGPGTGATATATLKLTGLVVTAAGNGYTFNPNLVITDTGAGTGATGIATITTDTVSSIAISNAGTGYTGTPTVTIAPPTAGTTATATATTTGTVSAINLTAGGAGYATGGIRKFVDSLPGLNTGGTTGGTTGINDLGQYLPVAIPDKTTYPGSDYYEIAVVQFRQKLSADLPATLLRGYVQLETPVNAGSSQHIQLFNASLNGAPTPVLDSHGAQVYGYDSPQYLGPTIIAVRNTPTRVKFSNLLPTGVAGDLFLPVDTTVMGAGGGPIAASSSADCDPMMVTTCATYSENRATLHLHGGVTPWISDGTPNQWVTPAGENTKYPKGVSVVNVPDMPDPGPGSMTFFYTNQQSARLMFYHDHSYGITRLNVYAGEAAGYILKDSTEQAMVTAGQIPVDQIPLIIQDKTFVPAPSQLAAEDPTWNTAAYGGEGNLWMPHVYMPNQNPADPMGVNAMGRWDYGPWFWPPYTGLVNGAVANPYAGTNPSEGASIPGTPNPSIVPEGFMDTPLVNGTAYPFLKVGQKAYRLRILNASDDRTLNLQLYCAASNGQMWDSTGKLVNPGAGEVPMVPAVTGAAGTAGYSPDILDGRAGGVPDVTAKGPTMTQIGTEGGFLPGPVTLSNSPIGYTYNRRDITVLNVSNKNLMLGPAERADVIVDFSQVNTASCSNIILYNDAPAPVPAFDPRYDYYTGDPDQTSTGGAPSTIPGYGPNTRTIMQFQVTTTVPASAAFNTAPLTTALPAAFAASQDKIIVPESAYSAVYGQTLADNYVRIQDTQMSFQPIDVTTPTTLRPTVSIGLQPKAIQELFETQYGRMNATLGVELPNTTGVNQTTVPLGYAEPYTEDISPSDLGTQIGSGSDGTQIWKITHNGVDTHAIHFHLFNVQLINRVGWDGMIKPPDPNELGWKETVRMNPLEDAIVALRPVTPQVPFGVPDSIRPVDVTRPTSAIINTLDPLTGGATTVTNAAVNLGWEYVWHCHLLGHEENDMMRPVKFDAPRALPDAPNPLTVASSSGLLLNWHDGTPAAQALGAGSFWGDPKGEVGYRVERADVIGGVVRAYAQIGTALANQVSFLDANVVSGSRYSYRVTAFNAAGSSTSSPVQAILAPTKPSAPLSVTAVAGIASATVTWLAPATDGLSTILNYNVTPSGGAAQICTAALTCVVTGLTGGVSYTFTVTATNALGTGPASLPSNAVIPPIAPNPPTAVTAVAGNAQAVVSWLARAFDGGSPITSYAVTPSGGVAQTCTTALTCTVTGLTNGTAYTFTVTATNLVGTSLPSAPSNSVTPITLAGPPTGPVAVAGNTMATVSWVAPASDGGSPITSYLATSSPGGLTCIALGTLSCSVFGLTNGTSYSFTVAATNGAGVGPSFVASNTVIPATVPTAPRSVTASAGATTAAVAWAAPASNGGLAITAYTVTSSPGGLTCTTAGALTCTVTGLTNGTTYTFTVTATNPVGTGPASAPSGGVVPVTAPSAPTAVVATAGNASALVTWTAPIGNGGSAVTSYTVTSMPGGLTCGTTGATSCTVVGLTNGVSYNFLVTATNAMGTSSAGASNAVTPATTPGAPTGVSAVGLSNSASVSWLAPASNGGQPITLYTVTSSPGGFICTTAGALSCTVTGLTNGASYAFSETATNVMGTGPASAASAAVIPLAGATYLGVIPNRIVDSRAGTTLNISTLSTGVAKKIQVSNQVPSDSTRNIPSTAVAVTGNLTVVNARSAGYVALTTTPNNAPGVSTINFPTGDTRANGVMIALAPDGSLGITFLGTRGATADVIFDVTGYFTPGAVGNTYFTVTPNRVVDSRAGTRNGLTTLASNTARLVQIANKLPADLTRNIPPSATAVTANVTVVNASSAGYLTVSTPGSSGTSTINFPARDTRANNITVTLGSGNLSVLFVGSRGATTDVLIDVTGYFAPGFAGATYVSVPPTRVLDSRTGTRLGLASSLATGTPATFHVTGAPARAIAVTGNLTAVNANSAGYLSLTTTPTSAPTTSTINFPARDTRANGVAISLAAGGNLSVTYIGTRGTTADVLFDVTGYFVP